MNLNAGLPNDFNSNFVSLQQFLVAGAPDLRTVAHRDSKCSDSHGIVVDGDGRSIIIPEKLSIRRGDVNLILYSPPYLNHIDYTEVYKIELWLLGFVTTQSEMLGIRKQTLRSHASIGVAPATPDLPGEITNVVELATHAVSNSEKPWHRRFGGLLLAYLADMQASLARQFELLKPGASAICIVANSAHGTQDLRVPIAVDLCIASIAETIGFEVQEFLIARQLRRRDDLNRFLRETAIVVRKPSSP